MDPYRIESSRYRRRPFGKIFLIAALFVILIGARSFASYLIEYQWWKEMGQTETWFAMLTYQLAPLAAATLIAFAALWIAHARAMKFAGTSLSSHPVYSKIATLGAAVRRLHGGLRFDRHLDRGALYRLERRPTRAPGAIRSSPFRSPSTCSTCRSTPMLRGLRAGADDRRARWSTGSPRAAGSCATDSRTCARPRARSRPSSAWRVAWNRNSCAAPPWFSCWRWRCASSWAATRWCGTTTAS